MARGDLSPAGEDLHDLPGIGASRIRWRPRRPGRRTAAPGPAPRDRARSPRRPRPVDTHVYVVRTPSVSSVTAVGVAVNHHEAVDDVAVAAAEPRTSTSPSNAVTCGWEMTFRQPQGSATDVRRGRRALGERDRRRHRGRSATTAGRGATASERSRPRRRRGTSCSPPREEPASRRIDQQVAVGDQPVDPASGAHPGELAQRLVAGRRVDDHLGDHRVVVGRDGLPESTPESTRMPCSAGSRTAAQPAALRLVVGARVLGVQPDLDRVAAAAPGSWSTPGATETALGPAICSATRSRPVTPR